MRSLLALLSVIVIALALIIGYEVEAQIREFKDFCGKFYEICLILGCPESSRTFIIGVV